YQQWCNKWAKELFRITKEASPILIFSSRRFQHRVASALEDNGFMIRDILIWQKDKCNAKAQRINNVLQKRGIYDNCYNNYKIGGFYCEDDKIPSNIIYCPVNKRNKYHETEKPIELIEKLIDIFSIDKTHTILDFTQGSGTTGIATLNKGRKYIGIELNENYFNIAKQRIEENIKI